MKKLTLGILGALLLGTTALAADIGVKVVKVASAPEADRWAGPYYFGQVGVGQTKGKADVDSRVDRYPTERCYSWEEGGEKCYTSRNSFVSIPTPGGSAEDNVIGLLVGAGAGWNFRTGTNLALGVEADGVYSFMNGYINGNSGSIRHQVPYILSLTGKAIYIPTAFPNLGIYGKGGLAVAQQRTSINDVATSTTKAGLTIGGGSEWQLPGMSASARIEYDFVRISDQVVPFSSGGVSTLSGNIHTVKAILSRPF